MGNQITIQATNAIEIEHGVAKCRNASDMLALAQVMIASGLVPQSFRTPQAVFMAMQYGAELKLSPVAALSSIAVINGKPSLYGNALMGVAQRSGLLEDAREWVEGEGDNAKAFCSVKRKGIATPKVGEFSAQDAKNAQLWGKAGPWKMYPKDMLLWKARARAYRALFGDVLNGMPMFEDVRDSITEGTPIRPAVSVIDPLQASPSAATVQNLPVEPGTPKTVVAEEKSEADESDLPAWGDLETNPVVTEGDAKRACMEACGNDKPQAKELYNRLSEQHGKDYAKIKAACVKG